MTCLPNRAIRELRTTLRGDSANSRYAMRMGDHHHIYKLFDAELAALKDRVLAMGGLVEAQIADSVKALMDRDAIRAQRVINEDRQVNQMELAIDEQCVKMLALRQPAASDLRFIASALKIV